MSNELFDVHSPYCEVPTGKTGTIERRCGDSVAILDASVCGATKPCPVHGGEFPDEADVPAEVRAVLLGAAAAKQLNFYWLCAVYRKGATDARLQAHSDDELESNCERNQQD